MVDDHSVSVFYVAWGAWQRWCAKNMPVAFEWNAHHKNLIPSFLYFSCLAQKRVDEEVAQLMIDIRRLGKEPGTPQVKFGELFDDDDVQQYYEALVGTLKSAKKRGMISFKGQMLLKGMHDDVVISITKEQLAKELLDNNSSSSSSKDSSSNEVEPSMTDEVPIMA